jgi:large subunit ribosomal protein L25
MKPVPLNAYARSLTRRAGARTVRATGRIPAVIYGRQQQPQNLEIVAKDLTNLIKRSVSENLLVDLSVKEDARPNRLALLQQVQHHPLSGKVLHVDFHEVAQDEKVTVLVPVETVGEPVGVKTEGGVLEHVLFKLKVRALPKDLPEVITLDVSHLALNKAIHIGEITPPPRAEILGDKNISVVAVAAPRAEEVETVVTEEPLAASDVEMIKEKKEGEGEEAPAKGAEKGEKGAEKAAEKAALKAGEKAAPKAGEKAASKAGEKAPEKPTEKPGEKKAEKPEKRK